MIKTLLGAVISFFICTTVMAATYWTATTGDWSVDGNWSQGVPTIFATINNGGTATVTDAQSAEFLTLGTTSGSGNVIINAGAFHASQTYVGETGYGSITQNNGNADYDFLYVGHAGTGVGAYVMNGGVLRSYYEYLGYAAGSSGTFTQNGGTNTVGYLYIGAGIGVNGRYVLNGGTLIAGSISTDSGNLTRAIFDFGGGTLKLASDASPPGLTTIVTLNLTGVNGNATIDTNGYTAAFRDIAGPGGLIKTGSGTLTLCTPAHYTGPTHVTQGELTLAYGADTSSIDIDAGCTTRFQCGDTDSPSLAITNNGTLSVDDGTHVFGNISGTGSMFVSSEVTVTAISICQDTLTVGGPASSVPEPHGFILVCVAAFALAAYLVAVKRPMLP